MNTYLEKDKCPTCGARWKSILWITNAQGKSERKVTYDCDCKQEIGVDINFRVTQLEFRIARLEERLLRIEP